MFSCLTITISEEEGMKGAEFARPRHQAFTPVDLKDYFELIGNRPLLTCEEEIELAKRIEQGDQLARKELIDRNLKLVVKIALYYCRHCPWLIMDIVQDGNIGLMKAAEKFDWRRGCRFSTYATWWIRQNILRGIHRYFTNRKMPEWIADELCKMRKAKAILSQRLGRRPAEGELAEEMMITPLRQKKISSVSICDISLNQPIGDGDIELGDFFKSSDKTPEEFANDNLLLEEFRRLIETSFDIRRQHILKKMLLEEKTLNDMSKFWSVTRERIRQIHADGIQKLQKTDFVKEVKELVSY